MILVDSNVLIYSLDENSSKCRVSQAFLSQNHLSLCFAHQNAVECMRVMTYSKYLRPMEVHEALDSIASVVSVFKIISPNRSTLSLFFELSRFYQVKSNVIFDLYLIATMLSNGVDTIATDNEKDFAKFEEIKVLNPFK